MNEEQREELPRDDQNLMRYAGKETGIPDEEGDRLVEILQKLLARDIAGDKERLADHTAVISMPNVERREALYMACYLLSESCRGHANVRFRYLFKNKSSVALSFAAKDITFIDPYRMKVLFDLADSGSVCPRNDGLISFELTFNGLISKTEVRYNG